MREDTSLVLDIQDVRRRFSSLANGFAFFDAPGGTQVPDEVGAAIADAMRDASGLPGAPYETSRRIQAIIEESEAKAASFLGCRPDEVVFGANMTTLNFALTRTAAREFREGDEILVSSLDHDGGVAPWLELAADRGLVVRHVALNADTTLDLDDLERKLSDRTRVVAFSWASNAVGTLIDAEAVCARAHRVGALAWIDAVHYAAHEPVDVAAVGADVLLCSPYKWCGPHLGIAHVRMELLEGWRRYNIRPAPTQPANRGFQTGTPPYALLAGLTATFDYLASIGGMAAVRAYERSLGERLLQGLGDGISVYGLPGIAGRVPTFLVNVDGVPATEVVGHLAERGYGVRAHDTWYCPELYAYLGYEGAAVRVGIAQYNTAEEVDGLTAELLALVREKDNGKVVS